MLWIITSAAVQVVMWKVTMINIITVAGQMVRTAVKDIRATGRNTQGVKLINLDAGDKLQAIAQVISEEIEEVPETTASESV